MDSFLKFIERVIEAAYAADVSKHTDLDPGFEQRVAALAAFFEGANHLVTRPPDYTAEDLAESSFMLQQLARRKVFSLQRAEHAKLGAVYFAFLSGARISQMDKALDVYAAVARGDDFKIVTAYMLVDNYWRPRGMQLGKLASVERRVIATPKNDGQIGDGLP